MQYSDAAARSSGLARAKASLPAVSFVVVLLLVAEFLRFYVPSYVTVAESVPVIFALMVAGTLIAVLRNEIGISTFGVFGPVIFAYAWLALGPLYGAAVVLYVFAVATVTRFALEPLDMGTPHRVATLLTTVGFGVLALAAIGQLPFAAMFGAALLFPIILSAWYGDRFVNEVRDSGWLPASRRLGWTLVAVTLAYLVISFEPFMAWFRVTPEAWVALVALNVMLGTGANVRVAERFRFGALRRSLAGGDHSVADILGMRARNRDFIGKYNPSSLMAAFDKARVKQSMHSLDIATPDTYAVLDDDRDLAAVHAILADHERVVFKPGSSHGGEGILVVGDRVDDHYLTSRGELTEAEIARHVRGILRGRYGGEYGDRDTVIVEEFVEPDGLLAELAGSGVPDLRVVVFQGYPVMAMARLPTEASKGTANLHGGGVGVGIDIETGTANGAYQQTTDRWLTTHPDTGASLADIAIPDWEAVLELAARAAAATGLGYVGVDVVFDARKGPVVLEVNRRPGLGIQNVNMAGLLKRLRFVEREAPSVMLPASEKVAQAIEWSRLDWAVPRPTAATRAEVAHEA